METYTVEADGEQQRLDWYLGAKGNLSRSSYQKLISAGHVKVNGRIEQNKKFQLSAGDKLDVSIPKRPEPKPIKGLYEDEDVIVFNKPRGILTHPTSELRTEWTLADELSDYDYETERGGIVHRLDRETSGVIITAKHDNARNYLQKQFADRSVGKWYLAVTDSTFDKQHVKIDMPLTRSASKPQLFVVDQEGREAITEVWRIRSTASGSVLLLHPKTGRTHQLRVHLSAMNAPIKGDDLYNPSTDGPLLLHAYRLDIALPRKVNKTFIAPLPDDMASYIHDEDEANARTIIKNNS